MIVLEDHILQKELNNLISIFRVHAYALHLIIKNIKIIHHYLQWFLIPIDNINVASFSDMEKLFTNINYENW